MEQMILEVSVMDNGYQVNILFNIGTMGDNLISGKFVSKNRIATENLKVPIFLKIVIERFRSIMHYKGKPVIQIGSESGKITEVLIAFLENYNIFLEMPYPNHY
jgi:hypothetical protein